MALSLYKPGQGYWTRVMSAVGLAVLVLMGVNWLWGLLSTVQMGSIETIYVQAAAATLVIAVAAAIGYFLIGVKPRVVEFLIATEGEMKKVNWSNRREIFGSTWVVIGFTIFLAATTFAFDLLFQTIFQAMNVLQTEQAASVVP